MKTLTLTFAAVLIVCSSLFSQTEGDIIILENDIITTDETTLKSGMKSANLQFLKSGIKFRVVEIGEDFVRLRAIDFVPMKEKKKNRIEKNYGITVQDKVELYNDRIYTVKLEDFVSSTKLVESEELISVGLLTLPFKARFNDDFSFDTEFNLNSTLNINLTPKKNLAFNWQFGAGIGTVGLNTSNAKGLSDDEAQDVSILTLLTGFMLEHKKVQVGLYVGVDHINNQKTYDWQSNGNAWFGFGIGYKIFNVSMAETNQTRQAN